MYERTFLFPLFSTAGFAAGSIPIIGIVYLSLKSFIAILVAVLQAITIALTSSFSKYLNIFEIISSNCFFFSKYVKFKISFLRILSASLSYN